MSHFSRHQYPLRLSAVCSRRLLRIDVLLEFETSTEAACGVVGLGTVVVGEDVIITSVTKESPAKFSDGVGSLNPTGGFNIERLQSLQVAILLFGEEFDADG